MAAAKTQGTENMPVNEIHHRLERKQKKRMLNAGITLNVSENK